MRRAPADFEPGAPGNEKQAGAWGAACLSKFIWQAIVIEDRAGVVTHFGKTGPLWAETLAEAQGEVDRTYPARKTQLGNCIRILEGDDVLSFRIYDREAQRYRWT
jgi:hypothetical protein